MHLWHAGTMRAALTIPTGKVRIGALVTAGLPDIKAEATVIVLLCVYMLWLHWFTVRSGLNLSVWRAVGLVCISNIVIGLLTFGPDLADLVATNIKAHGL